MTCMKRKLLLCFVALLTWGTSFGQGDLDALLKGSQADANYLAQGYLEPVLNAIGSGLNQGWYNTAANHKKFGFDLTISVSSIQFPSEDRLFHVDNTKLSTIRLQSPIDGNVPTFIGPDATPTYEYLTAGVPNGTTFQGPPGVDLENEVPLGGLPLPMVNLGIGIPWNTDVKLRYGSLNPSGGTKISLFGFAIQHDIKQHIPGLKELPFDLSALFGYTTFNTEVAFDEVAGSIGQVRLVALRGTSGVLFAAGAGVRMGAYAAGD